MNRKKTMDTIILLLFALGLFTVDFANVSSVPQSPYIRILPETILDEDLTTGMTFEVSVNTDYGGTDVWGWHFLLAFDPAVLEGVSVRNGDLITQEKNPDAWFVFSAGTFDNIAGTLSLTAAWYDFQDPGPYYNVTYGPGTLAYVTFRVKSYGFSYLAFDVTPQQDTDLIASPDPHTSTEIVVSARDMDMHIGKGYFDNRILGDIDTNRVVNAVDLYLLGKAYGSTNPEADINKDGMVNSADLQLLNSNYGRTQTS